MQLDHFEIMQLLVNRFGGRPICRRDNPNLAAEDVVFSESPFVCLQISSNLSSPAKHLGARWSPSRADPSTVVARIIVDTAAHLWVTSWIKAPLDIETYLCKVFGEEKIFLSKELILAAWNQANQSET